MKENEGYQNMVKYGVTVDCKCGRTMQETKKEDLKVRWRVYYKCYECGNEIVVNRWWQG